MVTHIHIILIIEWKLTLPTLSSIHCLRHLEEIILIGSVDLVALLISDVDKVSLLLLWFLMRSLLEGIVSLRLHKLGLLFWAKITLGVLWKLFVAYVHSFSYISALLMRIGFMLGVLSWGVLSFLKKFLFIWIWWLSPSTTLYLGLHFFLGFIRHGTLEDPINYPVVIYDCCFDIFLQGFPDFEKYFIESFEWGWLGMLMWVFNLVLSRIRLLFFEVLLEVGKLEIFEVSVNALRQFRVEFGLDFSCCLVTNYSNLVSF